MKYFGLFVAATLAAISLLACEDDPTGPSSDTWDWTGLVAPGDRIEIKGIIGDILATTIGGLTAQVTAAKEGHGDDPSTVEIEVVNHEDGVTICAMYPDVPGQPPNVCLPGTQGHLSNHDSRVEVTFSLNLPAGVEFVGKAITGNVVATDLQSDAFVSTITGSVQATTTGIAEASSVTGSVLAVIGSAAWDRDLTFSTVTGNVDVEVPASTNALVHASVVTGSIASDFPLTETAPGQMQGTLGAGGPLLTLSTVTGSVTLRRGG
jgi:hypothetical protein